MEKYLTIHLFQIKSTHTSQQFSGHQLGVLQFNTILTLSTLRYRFQGLKACDTRRLALTSDTVSLYLNISCSVVSDSVILWTLARQTPLSMRFLRQECQSGLPVPSPGDLPDPGIESKSPSLKADSLLSQPPGKPEIPHFTD